MKKNLVSVVALCLAVIAIIMCSICCLKKSNCVESVLRERPELVIEAMQNYEIKMREEAMMQSQKLIEDSLNDINNNPRSPVLGNPNGSIVVVEFFDYSCGYCHRLYPTMKNIIAKNPDVKFVAKELGFLSPMSLYAARATQAANMQGKYAEMHAALFAIEGRLTEQTIEAAAQKIGLDMAKFRTDIESAEVMSIVQENSTLAQKINVNGVPTLIINGKMVQSIDEAEIQRVIESFR